MTEEATHEVTRTTHAFKVNDLFLLPQSERTAIVQDAAAWEALKECYVTDGQILLLGDITAPGALSDVQEDVELFLGFPKVGQIVTLCEITHRQEQAIQTYMKLSAKARARVVAVEKNSSRVTYETLKDPSTADDVNLREVIRELAQEYSKLVRIAPEQFAISADKILAAPPQYLARQIDAVLGLLRLPTEEQQELLTAIDLSERFKLAVTALAGMRIRIEQREQINAKAQEDLVNQQKRYVLMEQKRQIDSALQELDPEAASTGTNFRAKVKAARMPENVEKKVLEEVTRFESIPTFSPENGMLRNYLDWVTRLPWESDEPAATTLLAVREQLDADHYGMDKVKERIVDFLATQMHAGMSVRSPILCLAGPPGTGKTSIARSIAKALGRKYHRIALGGVRDEAEIRGHRRTYIGSQPGRLIQAMKTVADAYPVIVLDEVDKVAPGGWGGDPSSALLEVLDPEQNREFTDHYLEVPFDLSKVMFICTANYADQIPPALIDRMDVVRVTGYTEAEKLAIARGYIIPKLIVEHKLSDEEFKLDDTTLQALIRGYTLEAGVRELERRLKSLISKVVRAHIEGSEVTLDEDFLKKSLGPAIDRREMVGTQPATGSATGLYYAERGGGTLTIEASLMETDKPEIILTGSLGDTMKESARVALTHLHSKHAGPLGIQIPLEQFKKSVHIHVPEGAMPKDGPSAGLAIASALASALTNTAIRQDVAMTGEIDTRGRALRIGGLKEKLYGAKSAGCKIVLIPEGNVPDLAEVPQTILEGLDVRPVKSFEDVWKVVGPAKLPLLPLIGSGASASA